jgi:hypothetical protein
MRFQGKELGLRGRLRVATPTIIGGVVALLMVAIVACDDAQPETTAESTISSPGPTASSTLTPTETATLILTDTDGSDATVGEQPFPGLEKLVVSSDASIIGQVEEVSELRTASRRDDPSSQVAYYEASVKVTQVIFGYRYARVDRHLSLYYVMDDDGRIPTTSPPMERGETVLLFLTQDDSLFGPDDANLVITDGDEAWGKFAVGDGRVTTLHLAEESQPLEEVTAWIEASRSSLAKPGLLAGEVSGLDEGDTATIRLMNLGRSHREENGVLVDEWTLGNGPWEQRGLRLSQGTYHLVPEAEGYLPLHRAGGVMFEVPAEGMDWRERNLGFAFFRPKDASDKPLSTGTGWIPEYSVGGWIVGLPDGVVATVRIQRLPPVPNELYVIGPPLPENATRYFPQELTCLEEAEDHLVPEETVAEIEVRNGRWGLSDHTLAGHRYLITLQTSDKSGISAGNASYVAVVFGGNAAHLLRGVDFYVGDAAAPNCPPPPDSDVVDLSQIKEEAVRNLFDSTGKRINPNRQVAKIARDHEGGFGGYYFHETDKSIVYVYMQDVTKTAAAEAAFRAAYSGDRKITQIIPVQGDYSLDQLVEWFYILDGALIESGIPPARASVREIENRIRIGLFDADQIDDVLHIMERLGIPEGAVVVKEDYLRLLAE